jgi:hypothetical protein
MARTVDKAQTYFLRAAGGDKWELWLFSDTKHAQFVCHLANPAEVPGETVVSLPAQRTITFPTWLATADRSVIPEMIQLQLEQRGLIGRNSGGSTMDYRVVESQENQTLVVATVLQPEFPAKLTFERALRVEPSARALPLPQDRLVIWREQSRLAVSATHSRYPVIYQVLCDCELSEAAAQELKCIVLQLEVQRFCEHFLGVTMWGEFSPEEINRVQNSLGMKVTHDSLPPPILPSEHFKLLPAEIAVLHAKKRRRRQIRWVVTAVAALYALLAAALVAYMGWETFAVQRLQSKLRSQTPTITAIQGTADRWRQIELAVNPTLFPVELFYQVSNLLPPDGLRLTAFEVQKGKVVIRGEASTAPGAFKFAEDIKMNLALRMFNWQMVNPTLRADGRAEFTIEGDPKIAKID